MTTPGDHRGRAQRHHEPRSQPARPDHARRAHRATRSRASTPARRSSTPTPTTSVRRSTSSSTRTPSATRRCSTRGPGTILYPTIGGGTTSAERFHHVVELASSGLIRASFLDPGLGEPRRRRARRPAAADGLRVHEHVQRHPLRRRRLRPAPARPEHRGLRARLPPGGARVPRGGRAARRARW